MGLVYKLYCRYTDRGCFYIVDERDSGLWGGNFQWGCSPGGWVADQYC